MQVSGQVPSKQSRNAQALAAFGIAPRGNALHKVIRTGRKATVYTIGYEKRDGEGLFSLLRDAGVEHLADIRDKPISRKPDFRASALKEFCLDARIEYGAWSELGSTEEQRTRLHETGDMKWFEKAFRSYAERELTEQIDRLAKVASKKTVALLCYERSHEDCHRSIVADLIAEKLNATIVAIL